MKKLLVLFFILSFTTFAFSAKVPDSASKQISSWVKDNYNNASYDESMRKIMYEEEVASYIWISENANDKAILEKVTKMYPPKQWGYSALKMIYLQAVKNTNMPK